MLSFFQTTVGQIVEAVRATILQNGSLAMIYLVGGFRKTRPVQCAREDVYGDTHARCARAPMVATSLPSRAVMIGAVKYGLEPSRIRSSGSIAILL